MAVRDVVLEAVGVFVVFVTPWDCTLERPTAGGLVGRPCGFFYLQKVRASCHHANRGEMIHLAEGDRSVFGGGRDSDKGGGAFLL